MSQAATWGVPTVGPVNPTTMAGRINDSANALLSGHSGASRPSYAVAGMEWRDVVSSSVVHVYLYDGTNDLLLYTYNPTTHSITEVNIPDGLIDFDMLHGDFFSSLSDVTPSGSDRVILVDDDGAFTGTAAISDIIDLNTAGVPSGAVFMWPTNSAPAGWLLCDGSEVGRAAYGNLYSVIGTSFGAGDGTTTFNLPDYRGRAPVGVGTGQTKETVANTAVNISTDVITVGTNQDKWITGGKVQLTTTGGLPAGLAAATDYFVIRNSATGIKFATSLANALAGTAINITSQGTGNHTITQALATRNLGQAGGEDAHALTAAENGPHAHTFTRVGAVSGSAGFTNTGTLGTGGDTTSTVGSGITHNIMQPYLAIYFIIKT